MDIINKLAHIQQELKAPKSQFNSFGKYAYRSCEDILESLKPLLAKYECALVIHDHIELIGERYYVKAVVELHDLDEDEEITTHAYAREEEKKSGMDAMQITGSASSYARKYALNGLFMIDDTKDADAQEKPQEEKKSEPHATNFQIDLIKKHMSEQRIERMLTHYKCNKLERLTLKQASEVIDTLKKEQATNGTNSNQR